LVPAVAAKSRKLMNEYEALRSCTKSIRWLAEVWWGQTAPIADNNLLADLDTEPEPDDDEPTTPSVTFEDWILLDAIYRSRSMEWPGQGEALVPAIDMANHHVPASAAFQVQDNGDGVLIVKDDGMQHLETGAEIFISYGDDKSPLEILFSYGFLPNYVSTAQSILLSLPSPGDDPLGPPKAAMVAKENCVPGIRIYENADQVCWDSEVLWLMILNEDDGLGFKLAYGVDGERELYLTWKDEVIQLRALKAALKEDDMWHLFNLRAVVVVMTQIDSQLTRLVENQEVLVESSRSSPELEELVAVAGRLREMEQQILLQSLSDLQFQVRQFFSVTNYATLTGVPPPSRKQNSWSHRSSNVTLSQCTSIL
jgi:hypothetical protein